MLSILNRGGNVVTRTAYNPFVKRDLNYGFSHGRARDTYHPYWTNNFSSGFDLKKRVVEQAQLPVFEQTRDWDSWAKKGKQREFKNSQLNWWLILGIISGTIGIWSFTQAKAEEANEEEEHVKLNEKNYESIVARLSNNDPRLLSIEVQITLNEHQLREVYEAIKDNSTVGYIVWHNNQIKYDSVGLINKKLEDNNKNYRYYPNDYVHALLSTHAYRNSKEKDVVVLGTNVDNYVKDWRVEKVYDDTNVSSYYGVIYVNDKTHQVVLASRGTEEITLKKLVKALPKTASDWKTNLEEIVGGKIIVGQQACNYLATEEAVKLVKEKGYHLSLTGHSLGAWLAELGVFYCHTYFDHRDVKAVTFDSPGSKQMMDKLAPNIVDPDTEAKIKNMEIVTYLSVPNPVNSCNQHVGKVYRVNREMEITKWADSNVPTFIKDLLGDKFHGSLSVEGHMLGGILSTFDPEIGKPKQSDYVRVADWPRLEYHGEMKSFKEIARKFIGTSSLQTELGVEVVDRLISDTTIMSFISLLINIGEGKVYQGEYWEYFKHINLENAGGKSDPRHDLSFDKRFALVAKAHYREDDDKNILKLNDGSVDHLLYRLHFSKGKLNYLQNMPEIVRGQLENLASSFEVKPIDDKGAKYKLIPVKGAELDADIIRQRMRRLVKVIPEGKEKLGDFFSGVEPKKISAHGEGENVKIIHDNIPPIKNLNFVGRKSELERIEEKLEQHNIVIICGAPGIGKTSLVKKYAYDLKEKGKRVRWIEAEYSKLADEYARLAADLNMSTGGLTIEEVRNSIYNNFHTLKEPVYLVLDNVDNEEELKRFLKNKPDNVKVIVSTRDERLLEDDALQPIKLRGLTEGEAVEYITKSLNVSNEDAKRLAQGIGSDKHMGTRPINLYLAVRYLNQNVTKTVKAYLNERENYEDFENNPDIKKAISDLSNDATEVLKYCAYLEADNVPIEILNSIIKDDKKLNKGINELRGTGLVTLKDRESLSLHREVQNTARDKRKDASFVNELLNRINEFFPDCTEYDEKNVEEAGKVVRSAVSIEEAIRRVSMIDSKGVWLLLAKLGTYYEYAVIDLQRSLVYYKHALTIARELYLGNHPHVANSLNNVGIAYQKLGELQKGLEHQKKALEMRQGLYVGNHPEVADSLTNVGVAYEKLGELQKGLEYQKKALEMRQKLYLGNHREVADSLNSIGVAYQKLGELDKEMYYKKKALEMRQRLYSGNHPAIAGSLNNVGIAYERSGDFENGLAYLRKALKMRQVLHAGNHPDVADSLNNVGLAYQQLGDPQKGLGYLEESLKMYKVLHVNNHRDVSNCLNNVGVAYEKLGDLGKGLEYKEKALKMRQMLYLGNNSSVASSLSGVAMIYEQLGDLKKGLEYQEKALQMLQALYINNHPDVAYAFNSVGVVYEKLNDKVKALEYYKQAYSIALALLGNDYPATITYKKNIESLQPNFFVAKHKSPVEMLFSEGCNRVGAECRTIIPKRGNFETATFQVKEKLQINVLNKIQQKAAEGQWSNKGVIGVYDWGVLGYLEDNYIKKELGSLHNGTNVEIAKMLCFEAINLGIMRSLDKPYSLVQEFTKVNPELVKKAAVQHPEYFVDGSIVEACIRAMPNDALFKEHLHMYTGISDFKIHGQGL